MNAISKDFSVRYTWCEGSVPPPHHYEFRIELGPGHQGLITFWPDYPQFDSPEWEIAFTVSRDDLARLYDLLQSTDAFRLAWSTPENMPVGDSLEWLKINLNQQQFSIPSNAEPSEALPSIYKFIRSLVPEEVWTDLNERHQEYVENYPDTD